MAHRLLLPLPDYQRIYQVAYSVLEASEIAITHRACIFFASVGTLILRDHCSCPRPSVPAAWRSVCAADH